MTEVTSTERDTVAAFVAPLVIYGLWCAAGLAWPDLFVRLELAVKSSLIPPMMVGFAFLTRRFGYVALLLAVVYLPMMYLLLVGVAFTVGGGM
jgi:hypothetical protein